MNIRKNSAIGGSLAIGIASLMWGFDGVVLTPRLFNLNVVYVVFVLHFLPFAIMNLFLFKQYRYLKQFTSRDYIGFALVGLFGGALGTLAIVKALFLINFQHLSIVVLLQKLQPIFAIILAGMILKERINKNFFFWGALAIIAGYTLTFGFSFPNMDTGANTIYASLYALLAAFSFGSSTVFSKVVLNRFDFKTATFYRYGFTTLIMLVWVLLSGNISEIGNTNPQNWLFFAIIALTTGSGAIFMYYYGLRKVKAMVAVIIELLFPVSTILFDYLINGSRLSLIQWFSALLMIFAIININRVRYKKQ